MQVNSSACFGQHPDGQLLVGEVRAGQLESFGRVELVDVDGGCRLVAADEP
ncbi:hypothetical protein SMICM304S_07789 [Streptomyces microflavus]